jgi:hypothetical protein
VHSFIKMKMKIVVVVYTSCIMGIKHGDKNLSVVDG